MIKNTKVIIIFKFIDCVLEILQENDDFMLKKFNFMKLPNYCYAL